MLKFMESNLVNLIFHLHQMDMNLFYYLGIFWGEKFYY